MTTNSRLHSLDHALWTTHYGPRQGLKEKTELTLHFLKRKQQEYEDLKRECKNL